MKSQGGGKREEIRGYTARDLLNINNNFKWLWQYVFGNINFTDINSSVLNKLSAIQNGITGITNVFNNHKNDTNIHTNTTEKGYWNNHVMDNSSHVTSIDKNNWNSKANGSHRHNVNDIDFLNNSNLTIATDFIIPSTGLTPEVIKIGSIINLVGTLKTNVDLSGEVVIATIPINYRPSKNIVFNVRTTLGLAKLNIYSNGEIRLDLNQLTGYISSLTTNSEISLNGITFKGA